MSTTTEPPSVLSIITVIGVAVLVCYLAYNNAQNKKQEKVYAQEEKLRIEKDDAEKELQYKQERLEKEVVLKQIQSLSSKQLDLLLRNCKYAISKKADENNKSPFGITIIDESSSSVYLAAASIKKPSSTKTIEERVKAYKDYNDPAWKINSVFPVLVTIDTFSGPKKYVELYECEYSDGPSIKSVSITWY